MTHLTVEGRDAARRIDLAVTRHAPSLDVSNGDVFDVEANVVAGQSFLQWLVVHLHSFYLRAQILRGKGHHHAGLQDAGLHPTHWHCPDTWTQVRTFTILTSVEYLKLHFLKKMCVMVAAAVGAMLEYVTSCRS